MTTLPDETDALLARVQNLPAAPKILMPLLSALSNPDTDLSRIVDMISVDPALTARLLQMCNSAYFHSASPVVDVSEAINRLGFQTVYRIVALARVEAFLRPPVSVGLDPSELWKHAASVGFAAQFIAQKTGLPTDVAFTAGILHDIGKTLLGIAVGAEYGELSENGQTRGSSLVEREREQFASDHAAAGARLLEIWGLAPELVGAVRHHHDYLPEGPHAQLAACLQLSDLLAHELHTPSESLPAVDSDINPAFELLGITPDDISFYLEEIREHLQFVEALCRMR